MATPPKIEGRDLLLYLNAIVTEMEQEKQKFYFLSHSVAELLDIPEEEFVNTPLVMLIEKLANAMDKPMPQVILNVLEIQDQ